MKFDDLFPNAVSDIKKSYMFEGLELFKYGEEGSCWNCDEPTNWCEINFEAHLCSEECARQKWQEYEESVREK